MKKLLSILVLCILLLYGCSEANKDITENNIETETTGSDSVEDRSSEKVTEPAKIIEINMIAKRWEFIPKEIRVKQGDEVKLNIEVESGSHGFAIPEFGVNAKLNEGSEATVTFVADKKGEFKFFCNVPCGDGHAGMNGVLIVE